MEQHFTSFKFSKKLWENGCRIESEISYSSYKNENEFELLESWRCENKKEYDVYPAYDILWDICVKYSKEFFGDNFKARLYFMAIMVYLQDNYSQEEIEKYIWENCVFNSKNNLQ